MIAKKSKEIKMKDETRASQDIAPSIPKYATIGEKDIIEAKIGFNSDK